MQEQRVIEKWSKYPLMEEEKLEKHIKQQTYDELSPTCDIPKLPKSVVFCIIICFNPLHLHQEVSS